MKIEVISVMAAFCKRAYAFCPFLGTEHFHLLRSPSSVDAVSFLWLSSRKLLSLRWCLEQFHSTSRSLLCSHTCRCNAGKLSLTFFPRAKGDYSHKPCSLVHPLVVMLWLLLAALVLVVPETFILMFSLPEMELSACCFHVMCPHCFYFPFVSVLSSTKQPQFAGSSLAQLSVMVTGRSPLLALHWARNLTGNFLLLTA